MQTASLKSYVRHHITNAKGRFFGTHYTVSDALQYRKFMRQHPGNPLVQTGFKALGMAPADILAAMQPYNDTALETPNKTMKDIDGAIVNRTLDNIALPAALDQRLREWISDASGFAAFKSLYAVNRVTAWRNYGFDEARNSEIFSNRYHLDADPQTMVKLFIHMSDVEPDCGPFRYMEIERTKKILGAGFRFRSHQTSSGIEEMDRNCVVATGPRGTAFLVMTSRLVHRASVPAPGKTRDMLQIEFLRSI